MEELVKDSVVNGSSVVEVGYLLTSWKKYGKWHRSREVKAGENPFGSFMLNKKWTLEEEFNNHMLRLRQVTASSIYFSKLYCDIPGWIGGH